MPIKYLKVFGERNTGTNYLNQLLVKNVVEVKVLEHGTNAGIVEATNKYSPHLRGLVTEFLID